MFVYYALAMAHPDYEMTLRVSSSYPLILSGCTLISRDHAGLLHKEGRIDHHPMVNNLSVHHPVGDMDWYIPGLPCGRHPHKCTFVRATCPADNRYQVIFSHHPFDAQFVAGKGCLIDSNVIFQRLLSHVLVHEFRRFGLAADRLEVRPNEFLFFLAYS